MTFPKESAFARQFDRPDPKPEPREATVDLTKVASVPTPLIDSWEFRIGRAIEELSQDGASDLTLRELEDLRDEIHTFLPG